MIFRRSHDDAQSFQDAWSGRPADDEQIAELVRFAESLCATAVVEPSPMFRESLRTDLMSQAGTALLPHPAVSAATPPRASRPTRRRVRIVASAMVASAGVIGLVAASASAIPGELLYPVKRSVESIELALHRDDASRGSFQLRQATERLAEAHELSAQGGLEHLIADTLQDFSTQAQSGSTALFSDFTGTGEAESIRQISAFAVQSTTEMSALSARLPPAAGDSFDAAATTISELATQASSLCVACTTADLRQLVASVATRSGPARTTDAPDPSQARHDPPDSHDPAPHSSPTTREPDKPLATRRLPTTPSTTPAPSLSEVTDPLLGDVRGDDDDDQEGLIPGLLNGLLDPK